MGLREVLLWINEWLKGKKQVGKKGRVFAVVAIAQCKHHEKGGGDREVAKCGWHMSRVVKTKVTVKISCDNCVKRAD